MKKVHLFALLLLSLFSLIGCASQKVIVNGLEEREANEILVFLASKNIEANKTPVKDAGAAGGSKILLYDISVPQEKSVEAMALLNANGLPRRRSQSLLNLFQAGALVPSEMQEKIRFQSGLAEQIASTIRKIDGVLDADVQLSFPEEDPLNPNAVKGKVTASVYVKHTGVLDDPNSLLVPKIKRLVASAVPSLSYDDVTVIGDRARFAEGALQPGPQPTQESSVRVWSVVVAKSSVGRFQLFFFSFFVIILVLMLISAWLIWKVYPIAHQHGGLKMLFSLHPLPVEVTPPKAEPTDKEKEEKEKSDKGGPKPPETPAAKVQENVESG